MNEINKIMKYYFLLDHSECIIIIIIVHSCYGDPTSFSRSILIGQPLLFQSDIEKLEGLPVAPFMDRDKVTKPSSQIGFIKYVLLPLFEALGQLLPVIEKDIIEPVRNALDYYTQMQKAVEEEKEKNASSEKSKQNGLTNKMNGDIKKFFDEYVSYNLSKDMFSILTFEAKDYYKFHANTKMKDSTFIKTKLTLRASNMHRKQVYTAKTKTNQQSSN
ncbi:PDE9A-like protein [Mya arenaria]|uniref:PDE9A-like protein n=1 Tax=Mya arenaria TaxID=6604 RepID=A0ABY7F0F5_MYAAR|nr:PDE9A-like protein [Mya arenaria]